MNQQKPSNPRVKDTENKGIEQEDLQQSSNENLKKLYPKSFPFWVFPKPIQDIILDTVECLNYPIDFISSSILFACGLANGLSVKIEVKKEWTETTAMYLVLVGRAGTNKSHPLTFALKPIQRKDNDNFALFQRQLQNYESDPDDSVKPTLKKVLTGDATVEAVADVHNNNKRGIGVYSDELKGWIINMNKYNRGSDTEFWLSSWSGKPIIIDRKSSNPVNIPQSFTSVIGTIQNKILTDVTGGKNSDNGFTDRLLFVIPKNLKKHIWNDNEISDLSLQNYEIIIGRILNQKLEFDKNENINPLIVKYSENALRAIKDWQKMNAQRYNSIGNESMGGIYSKMESYINRFALTLQLMIDSCDEVNINKVDIAAVRGAIEITEHFISQAQMVKNENVKQEVLFKDKLKEKFYNELPEVFKTNDAISIGMEKPFNLGQRYIERFLKVQNLFVRVKHGFYRKLIL